MSANNEEKIKFTPESALLQFQDKETTLGRQAVRCLELMVNQPGVVFSKEEFIDRCWKPYGYHVSDNSVRQAFFQLRRALDELGAPGGILQTLPRQGYCLQPNTVIFTHQNGESAPLASAEPAGPAAPLETLLAGDEVIAPAPSSRRGRARPLLLLLLGVVLFAAAALVRWSLMVSEVSYQPAGQEGEIHWFVQQDFQPPATAQAAIRHWLSQPQASLTDRNFIYINRSEPQNISFFACLRPLPEPANGCVTVTVFTRGKTS